MIYMNWASEIMIFFFWYITRKIRTTFEMLMCRVKLHFYYVQEEMLVKQNNFMFTTAIQLA